MAFSRRSLLAGAGAGLLVPSLSAIASTTGANRLIVVLAEGGWDTSYVFDPKIDHPDVDGPEIDENPEDPDDRNVISAFGDLTICTNQARRPAVTRFFNHWASRSAIVNGIKVGSVVHDFSRYRILTGTRVNTNADAATIVGKVHGADLPLGSIDTSGLSLPGAYASSVGRLGARNQLGFLLDPNELPQPHPETPVLAYPQFVAEPSEQELLEQFIQARIGQLPVERTGMVAKRDAFLEARERANRLLLERDLFLSQLNPGKEQFLTDLAEISVDLLAADVCRSITLSSQMIWDTHENNHNQHSNYNVLFDTLDTLVTNLNDQGLLDSTVVAVVSEMSRTPKLNATLGKDHWPTTSALLIGGSVRGGRVLGGTDDGLAGVPVDLATGEPHSSGELLRYDQFVAGMLALLDIDPGDHLPGVEPYLGPMA